RAQFGLPTSAPALAAYFLKLSALFPDSAALCLAAIARLVAVQPRRPAQHALWSWHLIPSGQTRNGPGAVPLTESALHIPVSRHPAQFVLIAAHYALESSEH